MQTALKQPFYVVEWLPAGGTEEKKIHRARRHNKLPRTHYTAANVKT